MDTQSTMPWVGIGSQSSPEPKERQVLLLADLLQLDKDELGQALFFPTDKWHLGPGAASFREYILNDLVDDFAEPMVDTADGRNVEALMQVYNITVELVREAKKAAAVQDEFLSKGYASVKSTAEKSVQKVLQAAAAEADKEKAQRKQVMAERWLSREMEALNLRRDTVTVQAAKAASYAAAKVHALIGHLRTTGMLSQVFFESMESWQEMDSTVSLAQHVKHAELPVSGENIPETIPEVEETLQEQPFPEGNDGQRADDVMSPPQQSNGQPAEAVAQVNGQPADSVQNPPQQGNGSQQPPQQGNGQPAEALQNPPQQGKVQPAEAVQNPPQQGNGQPAEALQNPPQQGNGQPADSVQNPPQQGNGSQQPPQQGNGQPAEALQNPPQQGKVQPAEAVQNPPQQGNGQPAEALQNPPQQGNGQPADSVQNPPQQGNGSQQPPQQGNGQPAEALQNPPQQGNGQPADSVQNPPQQGNGSQQPPQQGNGQPAEALQNPPQQGNGQPAEALQNPPQQGNGSQQPPQQGNGQPAEALQNPPQQGNGQPADSVQNPPQQGNGSQQPPQQGNGQPAEAVQNPPQQGNVQPKAVQNPPQQGNGSQQPPQQGKGNGQPAENPPQQGNQQQADAVQSQSNSAGAVQVQCSVVWIVVNVASFGVPTQAIDCDEIDDDELVSQLAMLAMKQEPEDQSFTKVEAKSPDRNGGSSIGAAGAVDLCSDDPYLDAVDLGSGDPSLDAGVQAKAAVDSALRRLATGDIEVQKQIEKQPAPAVNQQQIAASELDGEELDEQDDEEVWTSSSLAQNSSSTERSKLAGGRSYKMFKDIVKEHGQTDAEGLREDKKEKQSTLGDFQPGVPFWYPHPAHELFLCFDGATLSTLNENSVHTEESVAVNLDSGLTRDLRSGLQPTVSDPTGCGRSLQPALSSDSLGGTPGGKGKGKTKTNPKGNTEPNKAKKAPNYAGKANGKVKLGRTTLTDAKYWIRTIHDDQKIPDPSKRKVSGDLAKGYISQIHLYQSPMEKATEALDWKLVEGVKDEATLAPLVTTLDTAVENYGNAIRPIKALFVAQLHNCLRPWFSFDSH
ncbi:Rrbp1 [Symbiodinium sp. CCMP2592]|nr:Rrbp1 [Symbiodinium sp. CCMP2592]